MGILDRLRKWLEIEIGPHVEAEEENSDTEVTEEDVKKRAENRGDRQAAGPTRVNVEKTRKRNRKKRR